MEWDQATRLSIFKLRHLPIVLGAGCDGQEHAEQNDKGDGGDNGLLIGHGERLVQIA